jgi:hypothetical protein
VTQTSEYTTQEALAFIEAIRLALVGKVGFKWHVERLSRLSALIASISAENDRLNAYLDEIDAKDAYASYAMAHPFDTSVRGDLDQQ